ncbi:TPA: acyltransferase, partial [Vibrio vulnificus]|nr:acyltransferase [Vibrio vulnificus]
GRNCVIGAGSIVTKSIPDYCVVVGSPARIIKSIP